VEPSDEELCARVAANDRAAFELLLDRHQERAWRVAAAILGNGAEARDVSQEAFMRLLQFAHRFDGRARFTTWFHRILVNLCIDHQRRSRWWRKFVPLAGPGADPDDEDAVDPPAEEDGPEEQTMRGEQHRRVRAALAKLTPKQRAAVVMQVQEGLSSREIAEVLGCTESTARVHVHRGLIELRKLMAREA
jgi:RNA polymerase sigma-70 factor (ECF subfamily)